MELTKEAKELAERVETSLTEYRGFNVISNEDMHRANDILKEIKGYIKALKLEQDKMLTPAKQTIARIKDFFVPRLEKMLKAEAFVKSKILDFRKEEECKRRKEEIRLQTLTRQEEDRKKKALLKRADNAEAKGDTEKAEDLREQADTVRVPKPIVESSVEKMNGSHTVKIWKFRVVNELAIPRAYLKLDLVKIGATVRAQKETCNIPGVEAYYEETISSRAS